MGTPKTFIFDFDGTICSSFETVVAIANKMTDQYGLRKLTPKDIEYLRNSKSEEIIKFFNIPFIKLPFFIAKLRSEFSSVVKDLKPFEGMDKVLDELKKSSHVLGIITSNSEANVQKFIDNNNLPSFDFINSVTNIFGKGSSLRKVINNRKLSKQDAYYIGDETRDIDAAKENSIKSIAVTWGYCSESILRKQKPDYVVNTPQEIMRIASL